MILSSYLMSSTQTFPSFSDVVIKELLVIPEGFPVERTHSHLACPKGKSHSSFISVRYKTYNWIKYDPFPSIDFDDDKTLIWDLSLPDDVVEGSARAWVTAVGDLMGPALQVNWNEKNMIV